MTTSPIRTAVIGLGAIGQRLIKQFLAEPQIDITCAVDTNAALAQQTAADLGGVRWSTDYRAVLEGVDVDLVYVAVPPRFHHQIALDVLNAGKHILCEKPLALTLPEAKEMAERARTSGLVHAVNLPMFYNSGVRVFQDQVASGYLGDLRRISLNLVFPQWPRAWQMTPWVGKREQGGPIREVGPHLIDVILRSFGPIKRVRAEMEYPADPEACEIGAAGLLELANGRLVNVSSMANLPRPEEVALTAYGSRGTLGLKSWSQPVAAREGELQPLPVPETVTSGLIPNVIKAVRGEAAELPGFDTGLAIQAVLEAWEKAAENGEWTLVDR